MRIVRILLWFLTLAILALSLADVGLPFQNEPDGFRGLKWGDPPTEDMLYVATMEGKRRLYKLPNEKLHIGDAWFCRIVYSFFGSPERFMRVDLYFYGERNYKLLEGICQGRFGEETTKGFHEHAWMSPRTTVLLTYDMVEDKGCLGLSDWTIFSEYTEAKKKTQEDERKKQAEETGEDW